MLERFKARMRWSYNFLESLHPFVSPDPNACCSGQVRECSDLDHVNQVHLSDKLAAQRKRTEDAWFAATTDMQNDAWTAGRDKDRRVRTEHHEPERRCR